MNVKYGRDEGGGGGRQAGRTPERDITIITGRNSQCGTRHPRNALATCAIFNWILSQGPGPDGWLHYLSHELAGLIDPLRPLDNDTHRNHVRDFRTASTKVGELSEDGIIAFQVNSTRLILAFPSD